MKYMPQKPLRLITIPVSHYCEKVRWALDKLRLSYQEEAHTPPFHRFATVPLGGKTTPVLVAENKVFTDSTDILKYLNSIASDNQKIYPTDAVLSQQVEKLEDLFDKQLGSATRIWGYSYTMNNYQWMQKLWTRNVSVVERTLFPIIFPPMRSITKKAFNINPETVAESYKTIQDIFAQVSNMLADGRAYLVGDRFSAADLTFASLAAPAIQPPEHPNKPRPLSELPEKLALEITQFRETVAGDFVMRLYRDRYN